MASVTIWPDYNTFICTLWSTCGPIHIWVWLWVNLYINIFIKIHWEIDKVFWKKCFVYLPDSPRSTLGHFAFIIFHKNRCFLGDLGRFKLIHIKNDMKCWARFTSFTQRNNIPLRFGQKYCSCFNRNGPHLHNMYDSRTFEIGATLTPGNIRHPTMLKFCHATISYAYVMKLSGHIWVLLVIYIYSTLII